MEGDDDYFEQKMTESRSSINHGDLFGVPQLSEYELGRRKKQQYLIENIVQTGYDTTKFASFMESKLGKIFLANFLLDDGVNIVKLLESQRFYYLLYLIEAANTKPESAKMLIDTKISLIRILSQNAKLEEPVAQELVDQDYQDLNTFLDNLGYSPSPAAMIALRPNYSKYIKTYLQLAANTARVQLLNVATSMDPNIMLTRLISEAMSTIGMLTWGLTPQENRTKLIIEANDLSSLLFYKRLEDGRALIPDALTSAGLSAGLVWPTPIGFSYLTLDSLQEADYYSKSMTQIRQMKSLAPEQDPCEKPVQESSMEAPAPTCTPDRQAKGREEVDSLEPEYDKA